MKRSARIYLVAGIIIALVAITIVVSSLDNREEVIKDCTVSASELQATNLRSMSTTNITITSFTLTESTGEVYVQNPPGIANGKLCYSHLDPSYAICDVKLFDITNSTSTNITNTQFDDETKAIIDANYIIYAKGNIYDSENYYDIYIYNRTTNSTSPLITSSNGTEKPIYYTDGYLIYKASFDSTSPKTSEVRAYNILTAEDNLIKSWTTGDVQFYGMSGDSGNFVWCDNSDNRDFDIYMYDCSEDEIITVCDNDADQGIPIISGDYIVWEDYRNNYNNDNPNANPPIVDHDNGDIYGYSISAGIEFPIDTTVGVTALGPYISGNKCVYFNCFCGSMHVPGAINLASIGMITPPENPPITTTPISSINSHKTKPWISGNWVVWGDDRNNNNSDFDVYGYSISDNAEFLINQSGYTQYPSITENYVYWKDVNNPNIILGAILEN